MQLFYNAELKSHDTEIRFPKDESRHIVKVLRKNIGDTLNITNGEGWLFTAEIIVADIKSCVAKITSAELQSKKTYHLHLAVAPTKMNDRYEWFLEKATEIGIDQITPLYCDNSERRAIKPERFEKILQSAMKQSLQCYLPTLNPATTFKAFMEEDFDGQKLIAHCDESSQRTSLKKELQKGNKVLVVIGPEGDFSSSEIELAQSKNFVAVTLGETRLRTETAAIVACQSVAFINEL